MFARRKQPPIRSLIAHGSRIEGKVAFTDGLRIDGEVIGDVRAEEGKGPSLLVLSETARITGAVQADHVIVNGHVVGPIHGKELVELQPKARIEGDLHYKALETHLGAAIAGRLYPSGDPALLEGAKPPLKLATNNPEGSMPDGLAIRLAPKFPQEYTP